MRKLFLIGVLTFSMTGCLGLSFGDKNYNCPCIEKEPSCPVIRAIDCDKKEDSKCCAKKPRPVSKPARKAN